MTLYNEKMIPILDDLENPEIELAGGSTVGMLLSVTNSLIKYICNKTLGKSKYEDVQAEVLKIKEEADDLRNFALNIIDEDRVVLDKILKTYKLRKEEPMFYENACKDGVDFCVEVTKKAESTLKLVERVEKVGNRMLASDFEICKNYAVASIKASIVNVEVNLKSVSDEEYVREIRNWIKEHTMI